jgi:hypothetical protein
MIKENRSIPYEKRIHIIEAKEKLGVGKERCSRISAEAEIYFDESHTFNPEGCNYRKRHFISNTKKHFQIRIKKEMRFPGR